MTTGLAALREERNAVDPAPGHVSLRVALRSSVLPFVGVRLTVVLAAVGTGISLIALGWSPALPAFLVLASSAALLVQVDARAQELPDVILLPAGLAGLVLLTAAAGITGEWGQLGRATFAGLLLASLYLSVWLLAPQSGPGLGDVKLAGLLGLYLGWVGWSTIAAGSVLALLPASVHVVVLLARGRDGQAHVPFGPHMVAGAMAGLVISAI